MILGHAYPAVVEAIQRAAANGASFGASTPTEGELAEMIICRCSVDRKAALRQLRHRGDHVGHPRRPRLHRSQVHRQVRGLLSRPRRRPAGQGRLGSRDLRHPRLRRRARRDRPLHPRAALQRCRRRRGRLRRAQGRDRLRHRRAGRRQHGLRPARARLSRGAAQDHRRRRNAC